MFAAVYHWRIVPERDAEFRLVWRIRTRKILAHCGSYGSRLWRGDDGTYFSIALWPSRRKWEAPTLLPDDVEDERKFRESVEEYLGTETMESVDDLWALPADSQERVD